MTEGGSVTYDFKDRVVVVTGGARGQGLSHAKAFVEAGATVAIFDIDKAEISGVPYGLSGPRGLAGARLWLSRLGADAEVLNVDVREQEAVQEAFSTVRKHFGRLDVLVNNAGVNSVNPLEKITAAEWQAVMEVNLRGPFLCSKYAAPLLRASGGGSIILVSSLTAIKGVWGQAHYAASKAGLLGLMRSLAVELGTAHIRVNTVCPSLVLSPQTLGLSKAGKKAHNDEPAPSVARTVLPGVSLLDTSAVTAVVLWLASESARYITGHNLIVDAGKSIL